MITRDGELATIMQHQEEDKAQKIDGERIAGQEINADREGFASR